MKIGACLVGLALVATACAGEGPPGGSTVDDGAQVTIEGFLFQPEQITVPAGSAVMWENRDEILHTATAGTPGSETGLFDGEMVDRGATFSTTFEEAGTYDYFCTRHHHMRGTVVVR